MGKAQGRGNQFGLWEKEKVRDSLSEEKTFKQSLGRRFSV